MEPLASGQQNMTEAPYKWTLSKCWGNAPFWTGGSSLVQQSASPWFWVGSELTSQVELITKSSTACRNNHKHFLQWGFGDCGFLAKISRPQLETCNSAKFFRHPWLLVQDAWFCIFHKNSGKKCGNCQPQYMSTAQSNIVDVFMGKFNCCEQLGHNVCPVWRCAPTTKVQTKRRWTYADFSIVALAQCIVSGNRTRIATCWKPGTYPIPKLAERQWPRAGLDSSDSNGGNDLVCSALWMIWCRGT